MRSSRSFKDCIPIIPIPRVFNKFATNTKDITVLKIKFSKLSARSFSEFLEKCFLFTFFKKHTNGKDAIFSSLKKIPRVEMTFLAKES